MKVAFITLGCKVNQFETQAMESLLIERGHTPASPMDAEVVVINTCSVTAESARKSRQAARRAHRLNPSARLVVCGCYAEGDPDGATIDGDADFISGVRNRRDVVAYIDSLCNASTNYSTLANPHAADAFEMLPAGAYGGHARAYLKIQDGCDNYCAYCIIPYLRGAARSIAPETAIAEAIRLAETHREIVLSGIEITAYRHGDTGLVSLVERIAGALQGKARLRLGSLEPSYVTDDVAVRLGRLCQSGGLCPHFHLSLQSGTAATLRRMRRKYTPRQFADTVGKLRAACADPAITTDLIVGFPGETDGDFNETLDFISRVGFAAVHVFPYSKRPGTDAAALPKQLDQAVKRQRARRAAEVAAATRRKYAEAQIGRVLHLLVESEQGGHTENYLQARLTAAADALAQPALQRGSIVRVRIVGVRDGFIEAEPC